VTQVINASFFRAGTSLASAATGNGGSECLPTPIKTTADAVWAGFSEGQEGSNGHYGGLGLEVVKTPYFASFEIPRQNNLRNTNKTWCFCRVILMFETISFQKTPISPIRRLMDRPQ